MGGFDFKKFMALYAHNSNHVAANAYWLGSEALYHLSLAYQLSLTPGRLINQFEAPENGYKTVIGWNTNLKTPQLRSQAFEEVCLFVSEMISRYCRQVTVKKNQGRAVTEEDREMHKLRESLNARHSRNVKLLQPLREEVICADSICKHQILDIFIEKFPLLEVYDLKKKTRKTGIVYDDSRPESFKDAKSNYHSNLIFHIFLWTLALPQYWQTLNNADDVASASLHFGFATLVLAAICKSAKEIDKDGSIDTVVMDNYAESRKNKSYAERYNMEAAKIYEEEKRRA